MSEGDDGADKEHEASQKRLDQARERGEIVRSPDLSTAAAYGGLLLAAVAMGESALRQAGQVATVLLDQSDRLSSLMLSAGAAPLAGLLQTFALSLAPFFLFPAVAVLATLLAQRAIIFTPDKLMPKLSRISPITSAMNKFGRTGLFEFGKSLVKLIVVSIVLAVFLAQHSDEILGTLYHTPAIGTAVLLRLVVQFLFLILIVATVIGGLDYLWQTM
ncbi:MAG: EscU/YscU/HrcU family type III secretion system export apparatus switch protein, partial [Paracoccaceae bacterium]